VGAGGRRRALDGVRLERWWPRTPSSDPAARAEWLEAKGRRRWEQEEEADRLRQRAVVCAHYGLTGAEHDDMTLEFLDTLVRRMASHQGQGGE
jgi:hypothetical protein